jgi:hypothetical protein
MEVPDDWAEADRQRFNRIREQKQLDLTRERHRKTAERLKLSLQEYGRRLLVSYESDLAQDGQDF